MVKKILLALIIIGTAGYAYWHFFANTDERQIRGLIEELRHVSSLAGKSAQGAIALRHPAIMEYFAPICVIEVPQSTMGGAHDPQTLAGNIVRVNLLLRRADFNISDLQISVESPDFATASFNGHYRGETKANWAFDEAREVNCELRKVDGKWRLSRISAPEILVK